MVEQLVVFASFTLRCLLLFSVGIYVSLEWWFYMYFR